MSRCSRTPYVAGVPTIPGETIWADRGGRPYRVHRPSDLAQPTRVTVVPDHVNTGRTAPPPAWLTSEADLPLGAWAATADPQRMLGRAGRTAAPHDPASRYPWLGPRQAKNDPRLLHPVNFDDGQSDDAAVLHRLSAAVTAEGGRAVLVGGAVRDALLGVDSKDFDVEVRGVTAERLERILTGEFGDRVDLVGKSFAVYKVGTGVDVSLPRTEAKTGAGHRAFDVHIDPFLSDAEAAARRDLTVNAIGVDLATGNLVDPFNGAEDLARGVLRHVSSRFSEDPLRVLRAGQFAGRLGLVADRDTIALCRSLLPEREDLPRERVFDEYAKLLTKAPLPSLGLITLHACGWLEPELADLAGQPGGRRGDALAATAAALDQVAASDVTGEDRLVVTFAALTSRLDDAASTALIGRLTTLRHFQRDVRQTLHAAHALTGDQVTDAALRRAAETSGGLARAIRVLPALDPWDDSLPARAAEVSRRAAALGVLTGRVDGLVTGDDAHAAGVPHGRAVGQALAQVREAVIDGSVSSREQALTLLSSIAARFHS